jgi:hypothetical protein
MGDPADGPPVVVLPERFDRRMRLGPFPSARDALKFVTYTAVGAVLVPFTSPYLWLAIVAVGFAVAVFRPDGEGLDDRVLAIVLWRLRSQGAGHAMTARASTPAARQGLLAIGPGHYVAVVRTGGTPVAYLPPVELAQRFESFRELLRSVGGTLAFLVTSTPMRPAPVVPRLPDAPRADRTAAAGYAELVELLCRRRLIRRVDLVLGTEHPGPNGLSDLEVRVSTLIDRLTALGLRGTRLRHRALDDAARRWGWRWGHSAR